MKVIVFLLLFFLLLFRIPGTAEPVEFIVDAKFLKMYGGLSPFMKKIIFVESSWKSKAVSKKGAIGLMQILPTGALAEFNNYYHTNLREDDLFNPAINYRIGSWYIRRLIRKLDRDLFKSLTAYNMGWVKMREGWIAKSYCESILGKEKLQTYLEGKMYLSLGKYLIIGEKNIKNYLNKKNT